MASDRMADFLHALEPEASEPLRSLRSYAREHDVPIVRLETESFLRTAMKMLRPQSILEIGTAIAYSTIVMAQASEAQILTIESYEKRIPLAEENIRMAQLTDRIALRHADAGAVLKELVAAGDRSFDVVFLDAAKGQYLIWLPDILKLMHPGSVLIADNVLQEETVLESRFAVPRRERTTHERMREFLWQIKHDPQLSTTIIPLGDGVSVSVMTDRREKDF